MSVKYKKKMEEATNKLKIIAKIYARQMGREINLFPGGTEASANTVFPWRKLPEHGPSTFLLPVFLLHCPEFAQQCPFSAEKKPKVYDQMFPKFFMGPG